MSNILLTGATGFIGSRLVEELINKEYDVTSLIRKGKKGNSKSKIIYGDLNNEKIDFKKIEVETLVCTAKGDVGSTAEMSSNLGNTISNSTVVIFEQGKHMVGIECAEEVNKVFKNFIEGSR